MRRGSGSLGWAITVGFFFGLQVGQLDEVGDFPFLLRYRFGGHDLGHVDSVRLEHVGGQQVRARELHIT